MEKNIEKNKDILLRQAEELYELTKSTCEMCGGTFTQNLDGAEAHFVVNGKRFVMKIERR